MVISFGKPKIEDISNKSLPPRNPKYSNVKSTLDTGYHTGNARVNKEIKKRPGEPFSRLKASELFRVIMDYRPRTLETIFNLEENEEPTYVTHEPLTQSEFEIKRPYMLIDVRREVSDYQLYNIESSIHFPNHLFRQDKMPHEIYSVRSIPDYAIVVCSDTEEEGIVGANILVQKNCQNVYLLSTSISKFLSRFPETSQGTNPPAAAPVKKKIWDPKKLKKRYMNGERSQKSGSIRSTFSTRSWLP